VGGGALCLRVRLAGEIEVALPPDQAFGLFTPSGEREWAEGWDPVFLAPGADETEPGTVFTTAHGERRATWTVVGREAPIAISYVTLTPGERVGLVTVRLRPSATGSIAGVGYDLTALAPEANPGLQTFADHYPHFLEHWQDAIAAALAARAHAQKPGPG